jgi:hypothetical protein
MPLDHDRVQADVYAYTGGQLDTVQESASQNCRRCGLHSFTTDYTYDGQGRVTDRRPSHRHQLRHHRVQLLGIQRR